MPSTAAIWFYFRDRDYPSTMALFEAGKRIARGAAMMANVELDTIMVVGSGWSAHFNRTIAEVTHANIQRVGHPRWDENDQRLARALQRELNRLRDFFSD